MTATVAVRTKRVPGAVSVPVESVALRGDSLSSKLKEVVFVLNGSTVRQVVVETGIQDEQYIQLRSGLKKGEEVVRGPFDAVSRQLEDGMTVTRAKGE
jgi:HlyD family secretion protein